MRNAADLMKRMLVLALVLCLVLAGFDTTVFSSAALADNTPANGMVRVFLSSLGNPSVLNITVNGSYSLDGTTSTAIASGTQLTVNFNAATGALMLTKNGVTTDMGKSFVLRRHDTAGSNGVRISQARTNNLYPGSLEFRVGSGSSGYKLYTIAHVYIEDYLYGVLPYEMGAAAPLESLKAQCVSARTYTLRAMASRSGNVYDVVDTTNDQVYNGTPTGVERCVQAVDETRGLVLKHGNAFAATYYTASNGGQLDSVSNIWGSAEYEYVRVKDDPFDYDNSNSQVRTFTVVKNGAQSSQTLAQLLVNKAKTTFGATNVTILSVDNVLPHTQRYAIPSRLYTKLSFSVTANCDGVTKKGLLTFDIFSELEGALNMSINSDNNELWTVNKTNVGYTVQARRFGHGTGMSQRGAMMMGEKGYTFDEILAFYFEGCTLEGYSFVKTIMSPLVSGASSEVSITMVPVDTQNSITGSAIVTLSSKSAELALRVGASAGADVIMGIPHGAVLKVHAVQGDWCFVSYGEASGYVHKNAVVLSGKADGKTAVIPTLEAYGTVNNGSYLNLRAGAGTAYDIVAEIPTGTVLPLLDVNGDWAYTQYGRESGYVSMDYIIRGERYTGVASDGDAAGVQVTAAGGTRLYTTPSLNGYSVMTLPEGVVAKLKYTDGSWAEVYYAGVMGFVPVTEVAFNNISVEEIKDQPTGGEQYAVVNSQAKSVNMRDAANLSSNVIMEIGRGETVIVTAEKGEWYAVRYRGMNGYCMAKYLNVGVNGEEDGAAETLLARVTTESGSLNLRKSASKTAKILTTIPRNTVISVLSRGLTWSQVTYNGHTGYVMNEYLSFDVTQTPDEPSTPTPPPTTEPTTPPPSGEAQTPSKAKVTTSSGSLNLRKKASSGADILTRIPQYAVVNVLAIEGTWTKVSYKNYTGYVMSAFLSYLPHDDTSTEQPTPPPSTQEPTQPQYARVTTVSGSLNLRKRASASATLIARIPQNEVITVVEKIGTWTKVTYNGDTGYVMTTFLSFIESAGTPDVTPPEQEEEDNNTVLSAQVVTQKGSLNLRKRASSSASILTTIPQYAYVQVLERGNTWSKVTHDGFTGYVMSSFLNFVSAPAVPDAPVQPDEKVETPWARVTTASGSLNLRAKASSGAKILDTIPRHEIIAVVEKGTVWSEVMYAGQTGFVKNSFLTFLHTHPDLGGTAAPVVPAAPNDMRDDTLIDLASAVAVKALPAGASAALKKGCSEEADDLAIILRGEYVVVSARGENWCRIEYEGLQGYLPTEMLGF